MDEPILFSGSMVRALLADLKTNTRRGLSRQNTLFDGGPWPRDVTFDMMDWDNAFVDPGPSPAGNSGPYLKVPLPSRSTIHRIYPRIQPGDRLWVREAWRTETGLHDGLAPSQMDGDEVILYAADADWSNNLSVGRLRASMHMPRWASRITLIVTGVKVERLQDISDDDVDAEGFRGDFPSNVFPSLFPPPAERWGDLSMQECFRRLWESINGDDSWAANPWIAAYSFEVHRCNIDALPANIDREG